MTLLVLGLALFLGIHLVPVFPRLRDALFTALGEPRYKAMFSVVSALGLVLIVIGYARAPAGPQLFTPVPLAVRLAPLAMPVSFVLLASANMRTHIRKALRHPMLLGVLIWAGVHLLATGSLRAALLFGGFLAWSAIDLVSATRRHAVKPFTAVARQDVIAVLAGVLLALLVMTFHRQLFGVAVVPWGL